MSKSWLTLIIIALISLVALTGYELFLSLTGQNEKREYTVDSISPNFGNDVLDFLDSKSSEVVKSQEEI